MRTEFVVGYCSQIVPISAGSTKRCEVWHCPDGRQRSSDRPIPEAFYRLLPLIGPVVKSTSQNSTKRARNAQCPSNIPGYTESPLFSDADIGMVTNFDFPRIFALHYHKQSIFIACHRFFKDVLYEASAGLPRLKLMVTAEGSPVGINCYVFLTKVSCEVGGDRLWFDLKRYGPCQVFLPGTRMNTSLDMGKEVVRCSAA